MVTHPDKRSSVGLNQAIELAQGVLPKEFESWDEVPESLRPVPEESLFRSPKASEGSGGALGEAEALKRGNTVGVRDQVMDLVASQGLPVSRVEKNVLLPTTRAQNGENRNNKIWARDEKLPQNLENALAVVLPTPTTRDYKDGTADHERDGVVQTDTVARAIFSSGEILIGTPRTSSANASTPKQVAAGAPKSRIKDQVLTLTWGKFEPAIRRWESILGIDAPAPTKADGRDGAHRLSAEFTEWMMGMPTGWITGAEISRNEMLKACGNGVVPQQAYLALTFLLEGLDLETK